MEQLSEIDDTRFVFYPTSNYIKDRLTGETFFCNNRRVCLLLNKLNEKADRNAERYSELASSGGVDPVEYEKFLSVMKKYGISSVEKLDMILREERVW